MSPTDAADIIRLVAGYWPLPEIGEDEIRVWTRTLAECADVQTAAKVVDGMAGTGREFRLTAGQFLSEYRLARQRVPRPPVEFPEAAELPVSTDRMTPEQWQAKIKRQLGASRGPLHDSLGSITQGIPLDPQHPYPESVHERGIAYAKRMLEEQR